MSGRPAPPGRLRLAGLDPRAARLVLVLSIFLLTLASVSGQVWRHGLGHSSGAWLIRMFSLDEELNVPTAYQAATLVACSVLLFATARRTREQRRPGAPYWAVLSLIFLVLGCDEAVRLHERLGQFRDRLPMGMGRTFRSGWVMFGFTFVAAVGAAYANFIFRLPPRTRARFVIAALLYVGGAAGMEIVAGPWITAHGRDNLSYQMLATVEEVMEMSGVAVFLCAIIGHLTAQEDAMSSPGQPPPRRSLFGPGGRDAPHQAHVG